MKIVKIALVGAGNRGYEAFGKEILKRNDVRFVAVAEPDKGKRERLSKEHNIPEDMQFNSYEELFARKKLADGVIVATMDSMHLEPTTMALKKGYKVLLEKPIGIKLEEVKKIVCASEKTGLPVLVGHVLRYTSYLKKIKELLGSGIIGKLISIDHRENVGYWHFAHSYTRGNWRNTDVAAPAILAKSCHDMDLLYWLAGARCKILTSLGGLFYFKKENAPKKSAGRCMDCPEKIESACPYSAKKLYLTDNVDWPTSVISLDHSLKARKKALREGPYGRCVYKCDNNVADHQVVLMDFENEIKVSFTMSAFNVSTRDIRISGSHGEIRSSFDKFIEVIKFDGSRREKYKKIDMAPVPAESHGGGDQGLTEAFVKVLQGGKPPFTIQESAHSHFMAFAAEKSRLKNGIPVQVKEFEK